MKPHDEKSEGMKMNRIINKKKIHDHITTNQICYYDFIIIFIIFKHPDIIIHCIRNSPL